MIADGYDLFWIQPKSLLFSLLASIDKIQNVNPCVGREREQLPPCHLDAVKFQVSFCVAANQGKGLVQGNSRRAIRSDDFGSDPVGGPILSDSFVHD